MAMVSPSLIPSVSSPLPIYRFSVDQYHRMIDKGILDEGDAVELLEGLVVLKGHSDLKPSVCVTDYSSRNGPVLPPLHYRDPLPIRRFSVKEYQRMIDKGILGEDEPVELLEGWIIYQMPHNPAHDAVISKIQNKIIGPKLPSHWFFRCQSSILTDVGQPEPDLAIVRGSEFDYLERHPRPRDLALVIEVADSTLLTDREHKGPAYARVNIPTYWIVNIPDRQVEVYTEPTGADPEPGYRQRKDYNPRQKISLVLDGKKVVSFAVHDVLP